MNVPVTTLVEGSPGWHRQLAQVIEKKAVDILIYFTDNGKDEKQQSAMNELLGLAIEKNMIIASNLATADLIIESISDQNNTNERNKRVIKSYSSYLKDARENEVPSFSKN